MPEFGEVFDWEKRLLFMELLIIVFFYFIKNCMKNSLLINILILKKWIQIYFNLLIEKDYI